jgi:hypothetical protein
MYDDTNTPTYDASQYDEQYRQLSEQLNNNPAYDPSAYNYGSNSLPAGFWVAYFIVLAILLVAAWKVFTKAGKPGWAAIIPIYNTYVMLQIVGRPWWWLLLMLIPFVNIVVAIIVTHDLSKSFGKTVGWTVGMVLLPFIFYPMLAFGSAKYHGPSVKPAA